MNLRARRADEWLEHWRRGARAIERGNDYFATLVPSDLLTTLDQLGFRCAGPGIELRSLENRVFSYSRVDEPDIVVKIYRPKSWSLSALEEEHVFVRELKEEGVGVSLPIPLDAGPAGTIAEWHGLYLACFERLEGAERTNHPLEDHEVERLGRLAASVHEVGARRRAEHRRSMSPGDYLRGDGRFLLEWGLLPDGVAGALARQIEKVEAALEGSLADAPLQRIHGDMGLWSIIWTPGGPVLIDFDDMGDGPAALDLAQLALGIGGWATPEPSREERVRILQLLASGYKELRRLDPGWSSAVGPALAARRLHVSAWIASRWDDPRFREKYPDFLDSSRWHREIERIGMEMAALSRWQEGEC